MDSSGTFVAGDFDRGDQWGARKQSRGYSQMGMGYRAASAIHPMSAWVLRNGAACLRCAAIGSTFIAGFLLGLSGFSVGMILP